jgi:hypothetical protein
VSAVDVIFMMSFVGIRLAQFFWLVLSYGAFGYLRAVAGERERLLAEMPQDLPVVTVLIPALLTPSGELIQLEVRPVAKELAMFDRSDPIPWIIVAAATLIAVVAAIMLFLRFGRRRAT